MKGIPWLAVGPAPVVAGGLGSSGRLMAIAVSSDYDELGSAAMFLGSDGGGVWRSADAGAAQPTWVSLTDHFPLPAVRKVGILSVSALVVDPNSQGVVYAGTGAGIIKSVDGGDSWQLLDGSPVGAVKIVVDPRIGPANLDPTDHTSRTVFAGGPDGFHVSGDGGVTWASRSITGLGSALVTDLEYWLSADGASLTLYAGVNDSTPGNDGSRNGIYLSDDDGATWHGMAIELLDHDSGQLVAASVVRRITLAADHSPGGQNGAYAAITKDDPDWQHGYLLNVFQLTLGWTPIGAGLPDKSDTQGGSNQPLGLSPTGALYLGVSGNYSWPLFQTTDSGAHWSDISQGSNGVSPHVDHHAFAFFSGAVYNGNDGGIWRFRPLPNNQPGPGPWESLNTPGLQTLEVQGVSPHPTNPASLLMGSQDNGTALRSAGVWNQVVGGDGGRARFDPGSSSAYAEVYGQFKRSDDSGVTWTDVVLDPADFAGGVMQDYDVDPFGSGRVLIPGLHHVFASQDKGQSWAPIAPALAGDPFDFNNGAAFAQTSDPNTIYIGYADGKVFKTPNGGGDGSAQNWADVSGGTQWGGRITSMAADPANPVVAYLATRDSSAVWRTTDGGQTWQDLTANLPPVAVLGLAVTHAPSGADTYLFTGTTVGVYAAVDQGQDLRWGRLSSVLPDVPVFDLQFNQTTRILAAGTYGRGVWTAPVGTLGSVGVSIQVPGNYCAPRTVAGARIVLTADTTSLVGLDPLTYHWTVKGAQSIAGNSAPNFAIVLPATPGPVSVDLLVTDVDGAHYSDHADIAAISTEQASAQARICQLRDDVQHNLFVNPLWDPLRDLVTDPVTERELAGVARIARRIAQQATALEGLVAELHAGEGERD